MNIALITLLLIAADENAGTEPSPELIAEARFVLAGFKEGRSKVQSGEFLVDGYLDESWGGKRAAGPIEVFCAFDFPRDAFRFDRTWMSRKVELDDPAAIPSGTARKEGGIYVRLSDRSIRYRIQGNETVSIVARDYEIPAKVYPFDIRTIGICCWLSLTEYSSVDTLLDRYAPFLCAVETDGAMHRLVWENIRYKTRWEIEFDSTRDYVPVRYELFVRNRKSQGPKQYPSTEVVQVAWKQLNDVWVPSTCSFDKVRPYPSRRELTFSWDSVNDSVDESLFTWQGLDAPEGAPFEVPKETPVFDERLGTMVHVGYVGDAPISPTSLEGMKTPASGAHWWLTGCSVALLVVTVLLLLWGRRTHTARS